MGKIHLNIGRCIDHATAGVEKSGYMNLFNNTHPVASLVAIPVPLQRFKITFANND